MPERPFFAMPYPGIFRVTLPLPFPGLNHVHVYMGEGPRGGLVVVDTGLGIGDSWGRLVQGIRWLGKEPSDIEQIVLTHAHPDHIGMSKALQDASGAVVVCHPIAKQVFESMQEPTGWVRMNEMYVEHGLVYDQPKEEFLRLPIPERFALIDEGDEIQIAGRRWRVSWTPGHEWGHVAFFDPSDALLLSGDTVLGKITPNISFHGDPPDPLGMFMDSLDRLAGLEASLVLPGHGRPFEDGAERAHAIKAHHESRLRRMREIVLRRGPLPAIEISGAVFGRDLMFFQERLALSETLAHLEYLRLRGRLTRERVDGLWRYGVPDVVG